MKKATHLLTMVLAVTLLAACETAPQSSSGGDGGIDDKYLGEWKDDSVDDLQFDNDGNPILNNVELKMWSTVTNPDAEYQDQIIADFNKAYEGQIKLSYTGGGVCYHESRFSIYGNFAKTVNQDPENAPDVFYGYGERIGAITNQDLIVPVGPYLKMANIGFQKDYFETKLIDNCFVGDNLYGLPISVDTAHTLARKDILEKNGLTVPTNYLELTDACDKLVEKANAGELWVRGNDTAYVAKGDPTEWRKYSVAIEGPYYPFPISNGDMWIYDYYAETAALQNGGVLCDKSGMPSFASPEVAGGLQILRDWIFPTETSSNKYAMSAPDLNYDAGAKDFYAGTCSFYLDGAWGLYVDTAKLDTMYIGEGGSKDNLAIINPSKLLCKDYSKDYSKEIFGDSHAISLVKNTTSRAKRVAGAIFSNYLAEHSGGLWTKAGHLPASTVVQQSTDDYLDNPYYQKYVQYFGTTDLYQTMPVSVYYDYIMNGYHTALKQATSSIYTSRNIIDLLSDAQEDAVQRINDIKGL